LIWQLDWSGHEAPKLQNWAKALRGLDREYNTNRNAYQVKDKVEKFRQFFNSKGGIGAVGRTVSPLQESDEQFASEKTKSNINKKSESQVQSERQIRSKHIELGELYFSDEPPFYKNIVRSSRGLNVTRKGYAVALIRKTTKGNYDLLSITNDDDIVHATIVETYKRSDEALPQILRTLSESIKTQVLPIQLEKHRQSMNDLTDVVGSDGKTKLRTIKRLLFRHKTRDILLSECRTDCSVVTIAAPKNFPNNITEDITLRSVNHKFIEQNMLQSRDLCFFTTKSKQLEVLTDGSLKASHRLTTKNTVTDKIHNLYFYKLSAQSEENKKQADIDMSALEHPTWLATVTKAWLEELTSICISSWLREFGSQLNRDRHKKVMLSLSKSFEISYDGTRGNYTKIEKNIPNPTVDNRSLPLNLHIRSKDIFTILSNLSQQDVVGALRLAANENILTISFETSNASYLIAVPSCNDRGHLNKKAFKAYGVDDGY
jgi:hypothetical protein